MEALGRALKEVVEVLMGAQTAVLRVQPLVVVEEGEELEELDWMMLAVEVERTEVQGQLKKAEVEEGEEQVLREVHSH